nr:hypothetical protein Iba_chr12dCG16700 [Ipomoea batatas]
MSSAYSTTANSLYTSPASISSIFSFGRVGQEEAGAVSETENEPQSTLLRAVRVEVFLDESSVAAFLRRLFFSFAYSLVSGLIPSPAREHYLVQSHSLSSHTPTYSAPQNIPPPFQGVLPTVTFCIHRSGDIDNNVINNSVDGIVVLLYQCSTCATTHENMDGEDISGKLNSLNLAMRATQLPCPSRVGQEEAGAVSETENEPQSTLLRAVRVEVFLDESSVAVFLWRLFFSFTYSLVSGLITITASGLIGFIVALL